ncbi:MAG TPA: DUF3782 domain-containing protein [Thermoflexus sp.]|nr:DUF3782 domain-containing protein [Thermoflexus sp.]
MGFTVKDFPDLLRLLREHEEWRDQLRALLLTEELLRLPMEFRAFRDEVFEAFRRETEARFQALAEAQQRTEEQVARLAEAQRRHYEEFAAYRVETDRRFAELAEAQRRTEERVERMEQRILRRLNAFGARWGLRSEAAWREGMRAVLKDVGFQVERWAASDPEGEVFGYPATVELDVVIRNGVRMVIELKTSAGREILPILERKVKFYEKRTGQSVQRRILVTPWYEPEVEEQARWLGWEIYGEPEEIFSE